MKQHIRAAIAIAMVVALAAASSRAADLYWSGAGTWDTTNANWGTGPGGPYDAATWNNATPDTATFEGTAGTVTLGEAITVGGLIFYDAGYTIASNTLTFGADGSITANADAEIASDLAGGVALTKAGDGTLVLSAANTFSGALTLGAGTLLLTHPNAIAASSGLTLVTGSTLALRSDTSATFTTPSFATLAYPAGAAAVDVNNNGAGSDNTLTLSGGVGISTTVAGGGGTWTINVTGGNGYVLHTPVTLTRPNNASSTLVLNPTTASMIIGTLTHGFVAGGNLTLILGGTSTGNEVTSAPSTDWLYIAKQGTGTWTWAADNSKYLGGCVISGGKLIVTGTLKTCGAAGNAARCVRANTGGQLDYNNPGAVDTSINGGNLIFGGGTLDNSSGAAITTSTYNPIQDWNANFTFIGSQGANSDLNLGAGAVTMNATRTVTIQHPDTTLTVGGAISGAGFGLTKAGPGTLQLAGANAYTGATTINAGTLRLGADNTLNAGNNVVLAGGALDMGGYSNQLGTLEVTGAATLVLGSGSLSFLDSSALAWPGSLTLTGTLGPHTLRFGTSASALTSAQLAKISYAGGAVHLDADGYLVTSTGGALLIVR